MFVCPYCVQCTQPHDTSPLLHGKKRQLEVTDAVAEAEGRQEQDYLAAQWQRYTILQDSAAVSLTKLWAVVIQTMYTTHTIHTQQITAIDTRSLHNHRYSLDQDTVCLPVWRVVYICSKSISFWAGRWSWRRGGRIPVRLHPPTRRTDVLCWSSETACSACEKSDQYKHHPMAITHYVHNVGNVNLSGRKWF